MFLGATLEGCSSLTSVTIPEGITRLKPAVFKDCVSLEEIVLPNSLTWLEQDNEANGSSPFSQFAGCTNLTKIYFAAGENSIPREHYAPWGAPNPNVEVIKLTEEAP